MIMQWDKLLSEKRITSSHKKQENFRTEFQRDYDRIVFSNAFRRLQGKTQVFQMPENDIIHNRLTHSLEVSCVGRSLGTKVGYEILNNFKDEFHPSISKHDIGAIVASACLVHDIGNPPFGHKGEKIIQNFFKKNPKYLINLDEQEKNDLCFFDGNALGLRLLKNKKDFNLTFATLASFVKYPISSELNYESKNSYTGFKKSGIFKSEVSFFQTIANHTDLTSANQNCICSYYRHPLNFLVEAADDICYHFIDLEDAYRSSLIEFDEMKNFLIQFIPKKTNYKNLSIPKLRALAINNMMNQVSAIFLNNFQNLTQSPKKISQSLIELIEESDSFNELKEFSKQQIYQNEKIIYYQLDSELILESLLSYYLDCVFGEKRKIEFDLPKEYKNNKASDYEKIMLAVEYIASMTDRFAISVGKKISKKN